MKVFGTIIPSKESARSYSTMGIFTKASSRTISRMVSAWNKWWRQGSAIRASGRTDRWQATANILSTLLTTWSTKGNSTLGTSMVMESKRLITTFTTVCSSMDSTMDSEGKKICRHRLFMKETSSRGWSKDLVRNMAQQMNSRCRSSKDIGRMDWSMGMGSLKPK